MTQPLFVIEIHCIHPGPIDEAEQKVVESVARFNLEP